jgi:large subunit ribosomal protein L14
VGDSVVCVVKKGPLELRKQVFGAVIIRQKYPVRRLSGQRVMFEDNAAVIVTPEGDLKGTDIKGPVASEAAEKWPRIANLASIII